MGDAKNISLQAGMIAFRRCLSKLNLLKLKAEKSGGWRPVGTGHSIKNAESTR
jgi:hypothetical protein